MAGLFAGTMGFSALLMFLLQPMISKLVLPILGGTPAVWNTVVMCFQSLLLIGYFYIYATHRWLKPRQQAGLHIALLALSLLWMPVAPHLTLPDTTHPALWLCLTLLLAVGLPFVMISANTSLLSGWFSALKPKQSPYWLFAASNAGSLIGLLLYPLAIEPLFSLSTQKTIWSVGYCLLVVGVTVCLWHFWEKAPTVKRARRRIIPGKWQRRGLWVALSYVPSLLLLATTTHLTTDIAPIPLLWVIPLALYLFSFVLAYAEPARCVQTITSITPAFVLPLLLVLAFDRYEYPWWPWLIVVMGLVLAAAIRASDTEDGGTRDVVRLISGIGFFLPLVLFFIEPLPYLWLCAWYLLVFFGIALTCHGRLAQLKPATALLPEYYCFLALGGALGGITSSLLAPQLFNDLHELPLALVLSLFLLPAASRPAKAGRKLMPYAIAMLGGAAAILALKAAPIFNDTILRVENLKLGFHTAGQAALFLAMMAVALLFHRLRRQPLALGVMGSIVVLAGMTLQENTRDVRFQDRNFFGVLQVSYAEGRSSMYLTHGTTQHGLQYNSEQYRLQPTSYYRWDGPLGQMVQSMRAREGGPGGAVAAVGLGAGTVACLSLPWQHTDFYEINPMVIGLAQNPSLFTFYRDCPGTRRIIEGDARLSLQSADDGLYSLIILDAFNSDAIPLHLITSEALDLYLRKLAPGGVIAYHISNRHLDLEPVVGNLAAHYGLYGLGGGFNGSNWIFVAREMQSLGNLAIDPRFKLLAPAPKQRLWTDDDTSILPIIRWPEL